MTNYKQGRGPIAVADMKARIAAGWSVSALYDRMSEAERGGGYSYDMAESLPNYEEEELDRVGATSP
jgi:hypothetical protein